MTFMNGSLVPELYSRIIRQNYSHFGLEDALSNVNLKNYFDGNFDGIIDHYKTYPCWICMNCMVSNNLSYGYGKKPNKCPTCDSLSLYEVATFQARASYLGTMFTWSVYHILKHHYNLPVYVIPEGAKTHDLEITQNIVIEAKGSPSHITTPNGSKYALNRPGLMRTDTEKKAFANGATYKQRNPNGYFCIVTNAIPKKLLRYSSRDVNAIYDVTKKAHIDLLINDIKGKY